MLPWEGVINKQENNMTSWNICFDRNCDCWFVQSSSPRACRQAHLWEICEEKCAYSLPVPVLFDNSTYFHFFSCVHPIIPQTSIIFLCISADKQLTKLIVLRATTNLDILDPVRFWILYLLLTFCMFLECFTLYSAKTPRSTTAIICSNLGERGVGKHWGHKFFSFSFCSLRSLILQIG